MCGEAPVKDIATKFFTRIDVDEVVMHAKFESENLRGSDFTGVEIWPSPSTLHMGLNTVRATARATALRVKIVEVR